MKHPRLYVGPDGTHVGLILFSSEDKTMIKLGIGEIMDPYELAEYMGNLNYGSISGDRTRTELALELAKSVRTYLNQFNFKINITRNCDVGTLMNNIRYKSTLRDKNKAREKGGLLGNKGTRKKGTRGE